MLPMIFFVMYYTFVLVIKVSVPLVWPWGRNIFVLPHLGPCIPSSMHPEPDPYLLPSKTRNLHHVAFYKGR
jgi:hypothetical protein